MGKELEKIKNDPPAKIIETEDASIYWTKTSTSGCGLQLIEMKRNSLVSLLITGKETGKRFWHKLRDKQQEKK